MGNKVMFNKEARRRFLEFAVSERAVWKANFRDLNGAITRMATLAPAGRVTVDIVEEEIGRLEAAWGRAVCHDDQDVLEEILGPDRAAGLDCFDRVQLAEVLRVCRQSRTLSEAGRRLFDVSRTRKTSSNDADRLRKYLGRFGVTWEDCRRSGAEP
jgi:transcriptional regulatory protein RtcR